ncbi:Mannan endo-1,4-beta-mannosidase 2-like protein [Drosera capensis]
MTSLHKSCILSRKMLAHSGLFYPTIGIATLFAFIYMSFVDLRTSFVEEPPFNFVERNGTQFMLDGRPFYINGWNSYWLMDHAVEDHGRPRVREMLQAGSKMGLTVCRTWAFNDGGSYHSLQVSPGQFDELVFKGLDYVVAEARRFGIRLILSLVNNLQPYGGKTQYAKWAWEEGVGISSSNDSFFYDPSIRIYFKDYIKAVLTRKNTITGIEYRDDPAIFAWELINEPHCMSDPSGDTLVFRLGFGFPMGIPKLVCVGFLNTRLGMGMDNWFRVRVWGYDPHPEPAPLPFLLPLTVTRCIIEHELVFFSCSTWRLQLAFGLAEKGKTWKRKMCDSKFDNDWIKEMSAFVKSVDDKHLVTVGLEGFYGPKRPKSSMNPSAWVSTIGTDFIRDSQIPTIDFASVHIYPDQWLSTDKVKDKLEFVKKWMLTHIEDGDTQLKKPVMFTEYGLSNQSQGFDLSHRDNLIKTVNNVIYKSAKGGRSGAGSLIWQFLVGGMEEYNDDFGFVPWQRPSTFSLITKQSCGLALINGQPDSTTKLKDLCARRQWSH